jgi:hypothetical protein
MIDMGPHGDVGLPEAFLQRVRRDGVFFQFPSPDTASYWALCLADGFYELGIAVFANVNAYPLKEAGRQWLFPFSSKPPAMAAIVVGDISHIETCPAECRRIPTLSLLCRNAAHYSACQTLPTS